MSYEFKVIPGSLLRRRPSSSNTLTATRSRSQYGHMAMLTRRPRHSACAAIGTDQYYLTKLRDILYEFSGPQLGPSPSKILDNLYLGGYVDAQNVPYLRRLGITHVLNCAAMRLDTRCPYTSSSGIVGYMNISAYDNVNYNMLQHVPRACAFIESARRSGGKILVHCVMGINRSTTLVVAYLMLYLKMAILTAVRWVKCRRRTVLYNTGFQRQLVWLGRNKGLL